MSPSPDRLYDLLPVIYRIRDSGQGEPLRALLRVIGEQVGVVEEDIRQLYENWFIETCQDWVVPYIGDLVGYQQVFPPGAVQVNSPEVQERMRYLISRREVANTVRYRRRKGTLSLLEDLARDVAAWPARAVEFYTLLGWTQPVYAPRIGRGGMADIRDATVTGLVGSPFDRTAHTVDVRPVRTQKNPAGTNNIPNVGVYVWRLKNYPVTKTQACFLEERNRFCYTFSALGNDTPLFTRPDDEPSSDHIAGELNVPAPIRRQVVASDSYYGEEKSLVIWAPNWPTKKSVQPVPVEAIVPADLSDWNVKLKPGTVAVDPVLGRILFPNKKPPDMGVFVSYQYGFSDDIGGGEYRRKIRNPAGTHIYRVGPGFLVSLNEALNQWYHDQPENAVIEIEESGVYGERLGIITQGGTEERRTILLAPGQILQIRAADGKRPILRLPEYYVERSDALTIRMSKGSRFTLDGLMITGRAVIFEGPDDDTGDVVEEDAVIDNGQDIGNSGSGTIKCFDGTNPGREGKPYCAVRIAHCTLVPGLTIHSNCDPKSPAEPSLELWNLPGMVSIDHSIIGSIQVSGDEVRLDPVSIEIRDSIVDATGSFCESPVCDAICSPVSDFAYVNLIIKRSTVLGKVNLHSLELAENSIFLGVVKVARRQTGCMRFSFVQVNSKTPRRYHCQPDLVEKAVRERCIRESLCDEEKARLLIMERLRVQPQFTSTRYGKPGYCQLTITCTGEIRGGADDGSEMGVFHDLYQLQRETILQTRLDEYVPAGTEAGIFIVT